MENIRITEKNIIRNDIKNTLIEINRNQETIKRISIIPENNDFYRKQIQKYNEKITEDENKIIELEKRLNDVSLGILDKELTDIRTNNNIELLQKQKISEKKINIKKEQKIEDKKNLDIEYKNFRKYDGISAYGLIKETERYFSNCETLPDYIKDNLKYMPNNKGYIWKGISFFGNLPKESDTTVLFEKCRNGILKIYEITRETHIVYEKQGKGQKKLISNTPRKTLITNEELERIKQMANEKIK